MSFSLRLLNLFIGLCSGAEGLPRSLFDLGYRVERIEQKLPLSQEFGKSEKEVAVPEMVIASERVHHTILFEWKEGKNTEEDQLRRYSRVTADDLIKLAFLAPAKCTLIDVALVCREEHQQTVKIGIQKGEYDFPLMATGENSISTVLNNYKVPETDATFKPLNINWQNVTTAFFPLDTDSEIWEFAEYVIPAILEDMQNNKAMILASSVGSRIIPFWDQIGKPYRNTLENRIAEVIERASRNQLKKYLRKNSKMKAQTSTQTWDLLAGCGKTPLNACFWPKS